MREDGCHYIVVATAYYIKKIENVSLYWFFTIKICYDKVLTSSMISMTSVSGVISYMQSISIEEIERMPIEEMKIMYKHTASCLAFVKSKGNERDFATVEGFFKPVQKVVSKAVEAARVKPTKVSKDVDVDVVAAADAPKAVVADQAAAKKELDAKAKKELEAKAKKDLEAEAEAEAAKAEAAKADAEAAKAAKKADKATKKAAEAAKADAEAAKKADKAAKKAAEEKKAAEAAEAAEAEEKKKKAVVVDQVVVPDKAAGDKAAAETLRALTLQAAVPDKAVVVDQVVEQFLNMIPHIIKSSLNYLNMMSFENLQNGENVLLRLPADDNIATLLTKNPNFWHQIIGKFRACNAFGDGTCVMSLYNHTSSVVELVTHKGDTYIMVQITKTGNDVEVDDTDLTYCNEIQVAQNEIQVAQNEILCKFSLTCNKGCKFFHTKEMMQMRKERNKARRAKTECTKCAIGHLIKGCGFNHDHLYAKTEDEWV